MVRAALLVMLALAVGCGSDQHRVVVSSSGSIGKLQVDQSDRADVVAFAGKPDAEKRGRESAPYDALGYDCTTKDSEQAFPIVPYGPPYCRTAFWIDVFSGKLENFFTSDQRYVEAHGIHIGMPTARAERLLHRRLYEGCGTNFFLPSAVDRTLTVAFTGGKPEQRRLHVRGGQVLAFILHSRLRDSHVFDCW